MRKCTVPSHPFHLLDCLDEKNYVNNYTREVPCQSLGPFSKFVQNHSQQCDSVWWYAMLMSGSMSKGKFIDQVPSVPVSVTLTPASAEHFPLKVSIRGETLIFSGRLFHSPIVNNMKECKCATILECRIMKVSIFLYFGGRSVRESLAADLWERVH